MKLLTIDDYPVKGVKILNVKGEDYILYSSCDMNKSDNEKSIYMININTKKKTKLCRFNESENIKDYAIDGDYIYIIFDTKVIMAKFIYYWNKIKLVKITSVVGITSCYKNEDIEALTFLEKENFKGENVDKISSSKDYFIVVSHKNKKDTNTIIRVYERV